MLSFDSIVGGYPLGAEYDPRAPWNEQEEEDEEYFDEVEADDRRD